VFELVLTKLPQFMLLPLYPAIAILTVGGWNAACCRDRWLMRGAAWCSCSAIASVIAVVGAIALTRQPVFHGRPLWAAALIFGLCVVALRGQSPARAHC